MEALRGLPNEEQNALGSDSVDVRFFSGQKLHKAVEASRQKAISRKRTLNTSKGPVTLREGFDKITIWIHRFIAIGDNAVQYDPSHAALPWAAFRLVLQVCYLSNSDVPCWSATHAFQVLVNDSDRAAEFVKGMEQVAFYIYD